jgi:undecaprenyl diphosphate synthase
LQSAINKSVALTENNTGMKLSICWNYGGRAEIVSAAKQLITSGIKPENLDEKTFASYLYTTGMPDVDLLIRTGDETRLSNFLIWQTTYSEYYFTKVLWPDFSKKDIDLALTAYSKRNRRFGGL